MSGVGNQHSTRHFTASSCHEIGYQWRIEAPAGLTDAELERLQEALVDWSDEPKQTHLDTLLGDPCTLEEYGLAETDRSLLEQVVFELSVVHRETWCQDWTPDEGGAS